MGPLGRERHFATVFEAIADEFGSDDALVHGDERHSWHHYDELAAQFAGFLDAHGIGHDQKVGLFPCASRNPANRAASSSY